MIGGIQLISLQSLNWDYYKIIAVQDMLTDARTRYNMEFSKMRGVAYHAAYHIERKIKRHEASR